MSGKKRWSKGKSKSPKSSKESGRTTSRKRSSKSLTRAESRAQRRAAPPSRARLERARRERAAKREGARWSTSVTILRNVKVLVSKTRDVTSRKCSTNLYLVLLGRRKRRTRGSRAKYWWHNSGRSNGTIGKLRNGKRGSELDNISTLDGRYNPKTPADQAF